MGVKVKFSGGAPAVSAFSDPFTTDQLSTAYAEVNHGTAPLFSVAAGVLNYATSGSSGLEGLLCLAAPGLIFNRSQFIQATISNLNLNNRGGIGVYLSGAAQQSAVATATFGYFCQFFTGTINVLGTQPSGAQLAYSISLGTGVPANGDVMGLQVDLGTASNRVRFWQNGVLLLDVPDITANRVSTANAGVPGFMHSGNAGAALTYDNLFIRASR